MLLFLAHFLDPGKYFFLPAAQHTDCSTAALTHCLITHPLRFSLACVV
jgi:hypothetical protein